MPQYELFADFNNDGEVSTTPAERRRRKTPPGAIVLANVDADAPRLGPTILDRQRTKKSKKDDDLAELIVTIVRGTASNPETGQITVSEADARRIRVFDASGKVVLGNTAMGLIRTFPVAFTSGTLNLRLEGLSLPGSLVSLGSAVKASAPQELLPGRFITLALEHKHTTGKVAQSQDYLFSIAPLLFTDNTCPTRRLYICSVEAPKVRGNLNENQPTIKDLRDILRTHLPSVRVVLVPAEQYGGDSWIQDQFQMGYCQRPGKDGVMDVALHLPRQHADAARVKVGENLAIYTKEELPGAGLGLIQDLWERPIPVTDTSGIPQNLSLNDSYEFHLIFIRLRQLLTKLDQWEKELQLTTPPRPTDVSPILDAVAHIRSGALKRRTKTVRERLQEKMNEASDREKHFYASVIKDLQRRLDGVKNSIIPGISFHGLDILLSTGRKSLLLFPYELERFAGRLDEVHDSLNYGGNIEVAPPTDKAPLGTLLIGSSPDRPMDSELVSFLKLQGAQPIVEVDTSWLDVGHVDEVLTFAPAREGFCILRASPGKALAILGEALRQHINGMPPDVTLLQPILEPGSERTNRGKVPITDLFRGKRWLHHHPENALEAVEPPLIYRRLWRYYLDEQFGPKLVGGRLADYQPGEGDDRHYPARLSIREVLAFERDSDPGELTIQEVLKFEGGTNMRIEELLHRILKVMENKFRDVPIVELPVLFDAVEPTVAFTPNLVNMQVLDGHTLVPRPYGPRASPKDAIAILTAKPQKKHSKPILDAESRRRLTRSFLKSRGLIGAWHWDRHPVERDTDLESIVEEFRDGFPGLDQDQVARKILTDRKNRSQFNKKGNLNKGWRKVKIPEETVDLFEAYCQVVLEGHGLQVHWVDTWFYHIRFGEIHCGTNIVRNPIHPKKRARAPWWKSAPMPMIMEEEGEVIAPSVPIPGR